jgi:hypothetical protein
MSIEDDHSVGGPGQEQVTPDSTTLDISGIPGIAIRVITDPAGFYQSMPKSGGLIEPLIFMVVLAVVAGVLSAVLSLFGFGMAGVMVGGLMAVILVPILVVIFGFIGAAIAYVIWKLMGSEENFETAFRCIAYTAAIAPITAVLSLIPYLGSLVSALWPMVLLALASIHVHRRSEQMSWVIFGIIGVIFALIGVGGERASSQLENSLDDWQDLMQE